jgi:hypothetical protein
MQINGTDNAGYWATLDLAGLDVFTCAVSNVQVAVDTGVASTRPHGRLLLARTNVVTAANLLVGDVFSSGSSQTSQIRLGQNNQVNVDAVRVGLRKMRGTMNFNDGLNGNRQQYFAMRPERGGWLRGKLGISTALVVPAARPSASWILREGRLMRWWSASR